MPWCIPPGPSAPLHGRAAQAALGPQLWGHPLPTAPGWVGGAWGHLGVLRRALTSSSSRTTSVLPQRAASCSAVPALVCRLMSMPACSRSLWGDRGVSGAREGTGAATSAHGTHRMMSMWPFLAARCRGLVPLGSVASPGLGSSSAAHMLLFRSSWTTWLSKHRRSRAARVARLPAPLLPAAGDPLQWWHRKSPPLAIPVPLQLLQQPRGPHSAPVPSQSFSG